MQGNVADESSITLCIASAREHFGPINILIANAGITDESNDYPIWDLPLSLWEKTYDTNIKGTFLTIKHFLRAAKESQANLGKEIDNLAIVVTGSECGKFGQAGHAEYASGKAGLQYGLVRTVKNEIVKLNKGARINAVAPGWVDTPLIAGRLDDPAEMYKEAQATVPMRKIAKPEDVARTMAFLASSRAAGHVSGECVSVDGGMEGRMVWTEDEVKKVAATEASTSGSIMRGGAAVGGAMKSVISPFMSRPHRRMKIALSVDFDAVSGWLGTGASPQNNMADYSSGIFAGQVGAPRLVKLFKKLGLANKMTWFIPGHSMETFKTEVKQIVDSGAEIGLHGYSHEGAPQLTPDQEADVVEKCIDLAKSLTGKKPVGWRAPLYQIRETTLDLLEKHDFLYESSMTHHDSKPYYLPRTPPISQIDFSQPASTWMHPTSIPTEHRSIVEIPVNWYGEDMTPLQYLPHVENSHGYVDTSVIEKIWKERFLWIWENESEDGDSVFPLVLHPDTSGMAHVIGMIERFLNWVKQYQGQGVSFERYEDIAKEFKRSQGR